MTELSTLERKRLSDLHQIASQLGIKQYRKYRKPELAEMIYKVATEQAASQQTTTNGAATATTEAPPEAPAESPDTSGESVAPTVTEPAAGDGASADGAVKAQPETQAPEHRRQQQRQEERRRPDRKQDRGDRGDRGARGDEPVQSGILDVLPDGFGFLRTGGYSQSKGDVYVSTSQIKRFNLRRGDHVVGPDPACPRGREVPGDGPHRDGERRRSPRRAAGVRTSTT